MLQTILISSFITLLILFYIVFKILYGKRNAIFRIRKYINNEELREEKRKNPRKDYKAGLNVIASRIGNARFLNGYKKTIQFQLTKAHVLLKSEEYITVCIILSMSIGLMLFATSGSFLNLLAGAIAGWLVPSFYLRSRIKKRTKSLNEQLNDAVVLISNSLKAGYSFFQAIDTVAKEMTGPISEEFTVLQKEINLGLSTEEALENLAARVSSDDLELVVTAVLIQRQVGGNLSEVLDNISTTIRDRIKIKGEVKTVTAQGRISGLIISLLPPILGVILYMINPEHIGLLFTDPIGIGILVFSVLMELIGIYAISKIIKIEV